MLYDLVRGIGMNLELGRKRSNRRKGLARLELTAHERFLRGKHELVENGFAGTKVQMKQRHMHTVTHVTVVVKKFSPLILLEPDMACNERSCRFGRLGCPGGLWP